MCVCLKLILNFNLQPVGIGRVRNDIQACLRSFSEAFLVSALYFLIFLYKPNQTKPNKTLHLTVSRSEQNQTFQRWSSSFDHLFLPFKQVISSWSLWSDSKHLDKSRRVENSKGRRRFKYGNWIQLQAEINTNVESGLFLLTLGVHDWKKSEICIK